MTNNAGNIGLEYILDKQNTIFIKYAEAFRIPDLDARNSTCTNYGSCYGTGKDYVLDDQTSDEIEVGLRFESDNLNFTSSVYEMNTDNEIRYVPYHNNINLDPIRRKGIDIDFKAAIDQKTDLQGSFSYVDARFMSGHLVDHPLLPNFGGTYDSSTNTYSQKLDSRRILENGSYRLAGLKVPLVAEYHYNIQVDHKLRNDVGLKAKMSFVDDKFASNDQENIEDVIPSYYLFDVSLNAKNNYGQFSISIDNIFNTSYYNFAIASGTHEDSTFGRKTVYPLERRSVFVDYTYEF